MDYLSKLLSLQCPTEKRENGEYQFIFNLHCTVVEIIAIATGEFDKNLEYTPFRVISFKELQDV